MKSFAEQLEELIVTNRKCPLRKSDQILDAMGKTFASKRFLRDMSSHKSNWLGLPPQTVTTGLLAFLKQVL